MVMVVYLVACVDFVSIIVAIVAAAGRNRKRLPFWFGVLESLPFWFGDWCPYRLLIALRFCVPPTEGTG